MKCILFVDDEQRVLDGLRRMLYPLRNAYETHYVTGGQEALALLDRQHFDIIVSDVRMPEMSGVELLHEVRRRWPQMCRIVLSGQVDREEVLRCVGPIHQYLAKPCDAGTLKAMLARVSALDRILGNPQMVRMVAQIETLPSLPSLHEELLAQLRTPDVSADLIGATIARDVGMSAKVLQLVNSAFFGLRRRVSSPAAAVKLIGLETVRSLVVSMQVFSRFPEAALAGFSYEVVMQHAVAVGTRAKQIAGFEKADAKFLDDTFIAGLLHDVGKLVFASRIPGPFRAVLQQARDQQRPPVEVEAQTLGASHAEVGGYLLGLWGFAFPVVDAVAFHHNPAASSDSFSPLTAVYAAVQMLAQEGDQDAGFDASYLERCGVAGHLARWREICQQQPAPELIHA